MSEPLRIVLAHTYYQLRGGEDIVFEKERDLLRDHGHTVFSFVRHNSSLADRSPVAAAALTMWNPEAAAQLRHLIQESGSQVVHFHNTFPYLSPACIRAAHDEGVAVVATLHNYRLLCPAGTLLRDGKPCTRCVRSRGVWNAVAHRCYRHSAAASTVAAGTTLLHRRSWPTHVHRFIALSEYMKRRYDDHGFLPGQLRVKHNFVDPDPGVGPGDGGYVVFAGRLVTEKGVGVLLEAAAEISRTVPLRIVGTGPMAAEVEQAVTRFDNVEWLGELPHPRLLDLMGRAAAVLVPSIWDEPFGRTVIEAFAKGTPVIASDRGALPELVEHGVSGLIVPSADAASLVQAVRQLVSGGSGVPEMRQAARRQYLERFGPEAAYTELIATYREALQVRDSQSGPDRLVSDASALGVRA